MKCDILPVEFGEAGFSQLGNQLIVVALPADVRKDQMLRVFSKEIAQRLHCLSIAEVSEFARDASFEAETTLRSAKFIRVVVGFQHEQVTALETLFYGVGNKTEVGGEPDLLPAGGKRESDRGRIVRNDKGPDLNSAELECDFSIKQFQFLGYFLFFHEQNRFRDQVGGNTVLMAEAGASPCVVAVRVRNEDRADGGGVDAGFFHSASNLERAESGIKEQIAFGAVDD